MNYLSLGSTSSQNIENPEGVRFLDVDQEVTFFFSFLFI